MVSQAATRILITVFVLLHFGLAMLYSSQTPYRQPGVLLSSRDAEGNYQSAQDIGAPDERQHANYIGHLLQKGALPVFRPGSPNLYEEYQSHQPPLYYGLMSLVAKVSQQTDVESQSFGKLIRTCNAVFGSIGVIGAFFFGLWCTRSKWLGFATSAFYALLPMNLALSGAISNDPLLIALVTWSAAMAIKALTAEQDDSNEFNSKEIRNSLLFAGILAGLACVTKSSGLVAVLNLLVVIALIARRSSESPAFRLKAVLHFILIPLIIASPIWIRNQELYGDPLAQGAFKQAFGGSAQKSQILMAINASNAAGSPEVQYWLNWVGYWTARSFIGVFGYMDIWLNDTSRPNSSTDPNLLYKLVIAFNFVGLLLVGLAMKSQSVAQNRTYWVALGWLVGVGVLFAAFNNTYFQAQARYLFPALAGFGCLIASGWAKVAKKLEWLPLVAIVLIYGYVNFRALSTLSEEFTRRLTGS